ncbi:thiamine-phosphate kinase [Siculibacillus lacustris]|uniref:Thiamine-monophosphate kinase n=1 Tax=Siculibacillus lacustris TaxID=1549641 RepID=A0A4Q9VV96_9HYPH|nr:thiamine-phosphate kinase [Siculibacillus lacustris]TBW39717.1 thiamine-phosphate kinase [Siculibacillus lacustris]
MTGSTRPSEDDLIARWLRPLATDPAALQLGDDCACLTPPPGHDLVLKTDTVAAGVHFFRDDPWDLVARKALRVNLSDLAAKGARPLGYLMSLALPADWREDDLAAFARGLGEDQAIWPVSLFGGDTIRSPNGLVVTITALGAVPTGRMVRRAAARAGDRLYVSGTLGDAALGLELRLHPESAETWGLDAAARAHLARRYLLPEPRLALAPALLAHARAAMDLSDGLGIDLERMCRGSGVGAEIDATALPLSQAAAAVLAVEGTRLAAVVGGGDDYEILAAVDPAEASAFEAAAAAAGVPVAAIGRVLPGAGDVRLLRADGTAAPPTGGFRHF